MCPLPINDALKDYASDLPAWKLSAVTAWTHLWITRFNQAFELAIATPAVGFRLLPVAIAGKYCGDYSASGLRHELTLNIKRLGDPLSPFPKCLPLKSSPAARGGRRSMAGSTTLRRLLEINWPERIRKG